MMRKDQPQWAQEFDLGDSAESVYGKCPYGICPTLLHTDFPGKPPQNMQRAKLMLVTAAE